MIAEIQNAFLTQFGKRPSFMVRSPGRINLIGEHTDYNHGFVLPASINRATYLAFSPRADQEVYLHAFNLHDSFHFNLHDDLKKSDKNWPNYVLGVVAQLKKIGANLSGFNCTFGGDIPIGAGLSSSASVECGVIFGLAKLFDLKLDQRQIAKLGQAAENQFVGVNCGIMDQFANVFGKKDSVIKLDCNTLDFEYVPFLAKDFDIILCNSGVKHSLASSEYNTRRIECETGVAAIKSKFPEVTSLRFADLNQLSSVSHELTPKVMNRCQYVIKENDRVIEACKNLANNDFKLFGEKMYATHAGLKNEYEVSCSELDFLVDEARKDDSVLGARMMGGGFGGCTINFINKTGTKDFLSRTGQAYVNQFGRVLQTYVVAITDGLGLID